MHIIAQAAVVFGLCLVSEGICVLLPFSFPSGVISMLLMALLLLSGVVKEEHIKSLSGFLILNMAFFFLPSAVGVMEHFQTLKGQLLPLAAIIFLTVPLVYLVTAWTVRLLLRRRGGKGGGRGA